MSGSYFTPAPPPPTALGRYRVLSTKAGVHVSPLVLGAMSIGDQWHSIGFADMTKEQSFKLLDAYYEAGGNFIDTANNYQDETSEKFIGEWMESRGVRDQMVIATKYTINPKRVDDSVKQKISWIGNNAKSMHNSIRNSLKNLRTDYVDVYYVHWWDYETSIEEVMDHLHKLVLSGKVLYLGISDTPAWVVSEANRYAKERGLTPFAVYQGAWSVLERTFERDILPMAREHGMALCPWNVLASGKLRTDEEEERRRQTGEGGRDITGQGWERNEEEKKMSRALEKVAKEIGAKSITSVAIAYLMSKAPYVFPIVGGRKVEHLHANIEALTISLNKEQIEYIESQNPLELGFPHFFIGTSRENPNVYYSITATTDRVPYSAPIRPTPKQ